MARVRRVAGHSILGASPCQRSAAQGPAGAGVTVQLEEGKTRAGASAGEESAAGPQRPAQALPSSTCSPEPQLMEELPTDIQKQERLALQKSSGRSVSARGSPRGAPPSKSACKPPRLEPLEVNHVLPLSVPVKLHLHLDHLGPLRLLARLRVRLCGHGTGWQSHPHAVPRRPRRRHQRTAHRRP